MKRNLPSSWSTVSDSCCWSPPPIGLRLQLGIRRRHTSLWTARSNLQILIQSTQCIQGLKNMHWFSSFTFGNFQLCCVRSTLRWETLTRLCFFRLTFFTVRQAVLQVEGAVGEDLVAVGARKALRVEVRGHRLQAVLTNGKCYKCAFCRFLGGWILR